jgi:pimeloyl-ACP methyl ester carboxylesterase
MNQAITPFTLNVSGEQLLDLRERLQRAVIPQELPGARWDYGPAPNFIRDLRERLLHHYNWRVHEARINSHRQFTTEIDGQTIHFIHARSRVQDAVPLLLIHGWPGSIVEFLEVIAPLTAPVTSLSPEPPAFHLIIPCLPGFALSAPTRERGWNNGRIARALIALMDRLGYARFGVQGGDAGAILAPEIGRLVPDRIIGIHLNAATLGFIPMTPLSAAEIQSLTEAERVRLKRLQQFMAERSAFNTVQSLRPEALAYALNDSPLGLMAWMSELFTSFGDRPGAVDPDAFLTNFLLYWFTGTAGSSIRLYYENAHDPESWAPKARSGVPTAVAVFGHDEVAIRRFGAAANMIVRWTEFDRGGHFASLEAPDLWMADVQSFFESVRP